MTADSNAPGPRDALKSAAMDQTAFARQQMIDQQIRAWEVFDARVLCAFDELRREDFVPPDFRRLAFADTPIPLGHGETMMTPKVEGRLLQALALRPTDRVLEVGTGSGWLTALLATLAAEVHSIDIVPAFVDGARARLAGAGITNAAVECRDANALEGLEGYDAIAVTGSLPLYSPAFERMLNPGGRLFVIVGEAPVMDARLVTRDGSGAYATESLFETAIPALSGFPRPGRFAL